MELLAGHGFAVRYSKALKAMGYRVDTREETIEGFSLVRITSDLPSEMRDPLRSLVSRHEDTPQSITREMVEAECLQLQMAFGKPGDRA